MARAGQAIAGHAEALSRADGSQDGRRDTLSIPYVSSGDRGAPGWLLICARRWPSLRRHTGAVDAETDHGWYRTCLSGP